LRSSNHVIQTAKSWGAQRFINGVVSMDASMVSRLKELGVYRIYKEVELNLQQPKEMFEAR